MEYNETGYDSWTDADDVKKLVSCLNFHSPYCQQTTQLISLSSGINGEDDTNCDEAVECGSLAIAQMLGKNFTLTEV